MWWNGDYHFFDYKYNIEGYHGQDYMSPIQYICCGIALIAIIIALILLRKTSKEKSKKVFFILGIIMTSLYLFKTTWESCYDISKGFGFNVWLLPFDLCSLIMPTLIIAGASKKDSMLERFCATFICTNGFAGGIANFIFLRGLNYYPIFTFGALYSLFWHAVMIFVAFYIPVTKFIKLKWVDIFYSMVVILAASIIILPVDYIIDYDFMLINGAGGVPVVEGIASKLIQQGLRPLASLVMYIAYLIASALMISIYKGIDALTSLFKKDNKVNN